MSRRDKKCRTHERQRNNCGEKQGNATQAILRGQTHAAREDPHRMHKASLECSQELLPGAASQREDLPENPSSRWIEVLARIASENNISSRTVARTYTVNSQAIRIFRQNNIATMKFN